MQNGHQRQRSQYFFKDEHGRRQYYLGIPPEAGTDDPESQFPEKDAESAEWRNKFQNFKDALDPRKSKDKGKEREVAEEASEQFYSQRPSFAPRQPYHTTPVRPLPSLFAATEHLFIHQPKSSRRKLSESQLLHPSK